jgi:DNA-binding HxlR family transcriptional regulator
MARWTDWARLASGLAPIGVGSHDWLRLRQGAFFVGRKLRCMQRLPDPGFPCPVARVTELIGDPWTPLLLRDAMFGVRRFEDFHRYQGIGRNTLSSRLRRLVEAGVLETRLYQEYPPRKEYLLTDKGRELFAVVSAMLAWGERWLGDGPGELVELHHVRCGQAVRAESVCSVCGEPLEVADVDFRLGAGFPAELARRSDIRVRFDHSQDHAPAGLVSGDGNPALEPVTEAVPDEREG